MNRSVAEALAELRAADPAAEVSAPSVDDALANVLAAPDDLVVPWVGSRTRPYRARTVALVAATIVAVAGIGIAVGVTRDTSRTAAAGPSGRATATSVPSGIVGATTSTYDFSHDPHFLFCLAWAASVAQQFTPPPGATQLPKSPSGYLRAAPSTPKLGSPAEVDRFWLLPGTIASVGVYLKTHVPAGMLVDLYDPKSTDFSVPSADVSFRVGNHIGEVTFTLIRYGTRVAVQLAAQRWWAPVRPAVETIGSVVSVHAFFIDESGAGLPSVDRVVTGRQAQEFVTAFNAASASDGFTRFCAAEGSHVGDLVIKSRDHTFTVADVLGCFSAQVSVDGKPLPNLNFYVAGTILQVFGLTPHH